MRYLTQTDYERTCDEVLSVLEKYKTPISSLDRVLTYVKEMAYINSNVQNHEPGKIVGK